MNKSSKTSGIALIEVLVVAFVVGVGFMSLTSMQGGLMGGSRDNKTRAEAVAFANAKMEELRSTVTKTAYDALNPLSGSYEGKTERFTWSRTVVNSAAGTPETKTVTVSVCWLGGCATTNPDPDKRVALQSIIAFDSLSDAMKAAKTAQNAASSLGLGGPSVNAESSDDIRDAIHLITPAAVGTLITQNGKTYIVDGLETTSNRAVLAQSCTGLNDFENGLKTRRIDYDNVAGNEAIELYRTVAYGGSQYCTPELRYNGGVIIPIRGIVHSGVVTGSGRSTAILSVELFSFNASETGAYCYFKPETGATSAPYACYVGGNCSGVTDTTAMNDADVTKCPVGAYSAAKVGPGGWRGKVGLRGVAGGSIYYNVCFKEEMDAIPQTLDTARNYYARRNGNNEGINKPYSCHDFLIIDGKSTERAVRNECVDKASLIGGVSSASKIIVRNISTGNNIFDPVIDTNFCRTGAYNIIGSITGTGSGIATNVQVSDGTTTNSCSGTTTTQYTCNITTTANSVTISGEYSGQTLSCSLSPPSNGGCTLAFTPGAPQYVVTGSLSGTATAIANLTLTVADGSTNTNCQITPPSGTETTGSYICRFQTADTLNVAINARTNAGYSVTPNTYSLGTLSGTPGTETSLTGGTFALSASTAYTVSGDISLGNNVDNLSAVITSIENGGCTITPPNGGWKKNSTGRYTCTAYAGSPSMTFAITPSCSNTKSGNTLTPKKYTITNGSVSSLGTGQLVISFGASGLGANISGQTLTVSESTTACQ